MHQNHLVDKVTFEIGLKKSRDAFDFQNCCSNLIHDELLDAIEDACDKYSNPDEHIIIDKLEVNLGKLSAENFRWEMLEKFKSEFNLTSIKKIRLLKSEAPATKQLLTDTQSKEFEYPSGENNSASYYWEVTKHFLTYGNLPWFVEPESFYGFEKSLIHLIKIDSPIKSELKDLLRVPKNLTRFLSQASEETINRVYAKLFEKNIDWIEFFQVAERSISEIPHSFISISRQKLWQTIWQQSLAQDDFNFVLSSVWIAILNDNPQSGSFIFKKYFQDQTHFFGVTGIDRFSFLTSFEAVMIEHQKLEHKLAENSRNRQPDDSLEELNLSSTRKNQETDIKDNEINKLSPQDSATELEELNLSSTRQNQKTDIKDNEINKLSPQDSATELEELNLSSTRQNQKTDIKENEIKRLSPRHSTTENEPDLLNQSSLKDSSAPDKSANTIGNSEMELLQEKRHTQTIENKNPLFSPLMEDSLERKLMDFKNRMDTPDSIQKEIVASIKMNKQSELSLMEEPEQDRYLIENAGLVIFWPYLQIYFEDLGLLENKCFKHKQAQEKAMHLLQYIASGEENVEEHGLTLNKILCGWDIQEPLNRFIALSRKDKKESENLINAVIQNWSILGKTSIYTLQQNFILRKGILQYDVNGLVLRIEKGPYDVLIENIPWGLSMIKLSWMKQLLHVEW